MRHVFGDSLLAVRLVPALLFGLFVWLAARLARELGGGRFAQSLAALSVAIAPEYLGLTSFYSMNAFDLVFWAIAALCVARLARTGDMRLWRPLGLVIGVGLLNKLSILFFVLGLGVAVLATPLRRHLARRELWQGMLVAVVLVVPYVLWEMRHDWATLEFIRNATRYKNVSLSPAAFAAAQILELHPFNAPLWLAGVAWLFVAPPPQRGRALGIVFVVAFAVLAVQHGKPYYLAGAFPAVLAAGAVVFERFSEVHRSWLRPTVLVLLTTAGAVTAPFAIPVLPVDTLVAYQRALRVAPVAAEKQRLGSLDQHFADRFGWNELTREVARVYAALPADERAAVTIVTSNYGEAGALDYYGRKYGLPPALSPHNNYYFWREGHDRMPIVIAVGWSPQYLAGVFGRVEMAGHVVSPYAVPFETLWPIYVCREPKVPVDALWREAKKFI
jgi:4-amino-4-deoxy-L-arabinose transferase-like glycosyltransferase